MNRMSVHGKGQGLHGDRTTTGAMCITSLPNASENNRGVLRIDDVTTACPKCGKVGRIISGDARATYNGRATAVDGALVLCGCPSGSNRLIAPLGRLASERSSSAEQPPTSMAQHSAQVAKKPEVETMTAGQDKCSTPVFAKSRERGDGNTEAGTEPETHENFALMGYFRSVPLSEPEQHAQSAKRPHHRLPSRKNRGTKSYLAEHQPQHQQWPRLSRPAQYFHQVRRRLSGLVGVSLRRAHGLFAPWFRLVKLPLPVRERRLRWLLSV